MAIVANGQLFYLEVNRDEIRTNSEELEMTDAMVRQQDLIDNAGKNMGHSLEVAMGGLYHQY